MAARKYNIWWGPPKSFSDRADERKISWLELFYDLVYVAAISQITHHFAGSPTWSQLSCSMVLFTLVFWSWINGTLYYDLHGSPGIRTRLLTLWQMMCVAAVAITINNAYAGFHQSFSISFLILECLIFYLWWSTGYYDPSHNKFNIYYRVHYGIAAALFGVSYFTNYQTAFALWIVALAINLTPGLTVKRVIDREITKQGQVFTTSASIIERFGLFTIIMLGETIFGIVNGISDVEHKNLMVWAAFFLSVIIAFLLWWVYFDMLAEQITKKTYNHMQLYLFLNMPLLASLGITGATLNVMLSHIEGAMPPQVYWIFCGSVALFIFSIVALTQIMDLDEEGESYAVPLKRILAGIATVIALLPLFANAIGAMGIMVAIIVLLIIPIVVGTRKWVRYKMFNDGAGE